MMDEVRREGENKRDTRFRCTQCSKCYKRPEHLQRHAATHRSARDYRCEGCGATFQRSDVLGRHVKTCDGTNVGRRSAMRRACDACIKDKRKCGLDPPCLHCRKRGVTCTFTIASAKDRIRGRRNDLTSDDSCDDLLVVDMQSANTIRTASGSVNLEEEAWNDFLTMNLPDINADDFDWTMLSTDWENEVRSLRFLESFTRNNGFVQSFDCLTAEERSLAYTTFASSIPVTAMPGDGLLLQSHEIVTLIKETIEVKPRNNPVKLDWSPVLEEICVDFFSPHRIRLWLDLYWAVWHPNVNFMHRPTFNASTSKPCLLAAMCIIGALISPNQTDQESARLWMNSVEETVFRDDDVCYEGGRSSSFPTSGRLQAIQAMYMVCLFQNWEGDESSKSRIRRFRYSTVVAVARDINIQNARHPPYHLLQPSTFSWHGFLAREQLIRVLLWVFLLDTAFVIFNNVPPRMAIKEMKMHFACNEACFQAPTSVLCFGLLSRDLVNRRYMLSSLTMMMCKKSITADEQMSLADLGPLNLFALTSALHSVIFQTQQAFGSETDFDPIRLALSNWDTIWKIYSTSNAMTTNHCPLLNIPWHPDNMWQRIGFMRFCSEYWLLAKLIVDRITDGAQRNEIVFGDNSAETEFGNNDGSSPSMLEKYDETSMRQVNELISEFQKVIL